MTRWRSLMLLACLLSGCVEGQVQVRSDQPASNSLQPRDPMREMRQQNFGWLQECAAKAQAMPTELDEAGLLQVRLREVEVELCWISRWLESLGSDESLRRARNEFDLRQRMLEVDRSYLQLRLEALKSE